MNFEKQVWNASRKLWRHALKFTRGDEALTEDLLSDTVLAALTSKSRPVTGIGPWLYGVLRYTYFRYRCKGYKRIQDAAENGPRLIFTDTIPDQHDLCTPEAILIAKQGLGQMQNADPRPRGRAKLTDNDVIYIRKAKRSARYLRARFGVSHYTIAGIRNGTLYPHIQEVTA